ncbi:HAD-IB family hydrolase [Pseudohalioglobus lutimaris]|uniref:1-acyl-sn-glycerol-3-phosphate acyltransferase n=1 Tax=Pseudohalioglobus lutimaris TaxID=1737061 RepID=A0A2N5WX37_9GAMM|nr:HAD-IB family hydrolase [Pseudohalioglobus lutimaris]PLW66804.1 HAD-IB family hydrolase [Pseudohalioglobus lutimaris]
MASIQQLLQDIEASPAGPQITAIFDFDGTIISGYSATVFIREQLRRGDVSPRDFLEIVGAMTNFGMGNLGFSGMMAVNAQFMRGIEESTYYEVGEELYTKQIARRIYPESRALVDAHMAKGHTVAIISSATPYQVEPAAADLGIEHVLCTRLEVDEGQFTGAVISPTCFGQGKVDAAEDLAAQVKGNLDDAFFYSDSTDDLLLLERVGQPRALNPSDKLERVANKRSWPVAHFGSRGRPSVSQFLRSVAATSSLVTSFVAGLPIYALTGSKRDSINFSFSLFADTASALIGLELDVKGEEHLWEQRPAVFVFNHQSKADVVIMARLLRRDIAGIGKQEIKTETPILGKVLEFGGVVFIDRSNAKSAIDSITPLVDAMRNEGKSVVLAPEGTRTVSPTLAPFKKGAFHIAMQAGVPVIPIVIRNAGDVAPKGDFVFRPATVEVEVLPPVDTSDWTPETVDQHVIEVRNMFARSLGQPELEVPAKATKKKTASAKKPAATATKAPPTKRATAKKKTPVKKKAASKSKTPAKAKAKAAAKKKTASKTKANTARKSAAKRKAPASARPKSKARPKRDT